MTPNNKLPIFLVSIPLLLIIFAIVSVSFLGGTESLPTFPLDILKASRWAGALVMLVLAYFTVRMISIHAISPEKTNEFSFRILIGFWILFPPIWFFFEYLMIDYRVFGTSNELRDLAYIKVYGEYSSKIWAAFLAFFLFIAKATDLDSKE